VVPKLRVSVSCPQRLPVRTPYIEGGLAKTQNLAPRLRARPVTTNPKVASRVIMEWHYGLGRYSLILVGLLFYVTLNCSER